MSNPVLALREAIHARLVEDAVLTALLGGAFVYDEAPRGITGLYVTFGEARAQDWSTGTDRGHAHDLALTVWSRPGGARPALLAAERIAALLDDGPLSPAGHRLVWIRLAAQEVRRDERAGRSRVVLRLRAVTEAD